MTTRHAALLATLLILGPISACLLAAYFKWKDKTMDKKQIKERAQDELMHALQTAFNEFTLDELRPDMDRQMTRVEKLFGYDPGSWVRGT